MFQNVNQSLERICKVCDRIIKVLERDKLTNYLDEVITSEDLIQDRKYVCDAVKYLLNDKPSALSESLEKAVIVQDYVWEKLNTGHWKEVWRGWRDIYAVAALIRVKIIVESLKIFTSRVSDVSVPEPLVNNSATGKAADLDTFNTQDVKTISEISLKRKLSSDQSETVKLGPGVRKQPCDMKTDIDVLSILENVVGTCDMGLLLGGPVLNNSLELVAQLLTETISEINCDANQISTQQLQEAEGNEQSGDVFLLEDVQVSLPMSCQRLVELEKIEEPDIETFVIKYKTPETPIILTGCISDWPALTGPRKWSVTSLVRMAGPRTVPIEIGNNYTSDQWTQKLMTVRDFANKYLLIENDEKGYLAQHQLLDQIPGLAKDISIPDLCFTGQQDDVDINVWIGPKGTISPLHTDPKHNFLCQVSGSKYVVLYPANCSTFMYPHPSPLLFNTSRVDLQKVDLESFPDFHLASGWHQILNPGDMLYIPPGVWHFVKSLETSFSVSFWWS